MYKFRKLLLILVPFFFAIGLQIGIGIIGGLIYYLSNLIFILISKWEFIKNGNIDFNIIFNEMITQEKFLVKYLTILYAIISIIVFYIWGRKYNKTDIKTKVILSVKNISLLFFLSLGYGFLEIGAFKLVMSGFYNVYQDYINMVNQFNSGNQIISLLYLLLIGPISEELIFRGIILKKACNEFTFIRANIIQAILFGLYHMNIVQGVYTSIAGLLLGYIAYRYKTVKASIVVHIFLNLNLSSLLINCFYPSTTIYVISCTIGTVLFLVMMRIIKKQEI